MKTNLKAIFDVRKEFYGKATIDIDSVKNEVKLYSYNTHVATLKKGKVEVYGIYSATTLRHIKEFLKQNGFKGETKKQIIDDYVLLYPLKGGE